MDQKSNSEIVIADDSIIEVTDGWSERELELLAQTEQEGVKPIAITMTDKMLSLFLEGYSCKYIAKQVPGLTEGDVLFYRKKYNWDTQKNDHIIMLSQQVREKMVKSKLESIEYLTNLLSTVHKKENAGLVKYLMSGKEEDLPEIKSLRSYKEIIEVLQKVTGEDKTQKVNINQKTESTINITQNAKKDAEVIDIILQPINAARVLKQHLKDKK